jgi:hypothetical protein
MFMTRRTIAGYAAPALMLLLPSIASARTWHVFEDGSGDAPTIQAAIDSSTSGDVVLVSPGTYYEHINFNGKDIHLLSSTGAASTIIDGNQEPGSVVTFENGETNAAILEGFTLTGGTGTSIPAWVPDILWGGGILCLAEPTITSCIIKANSADDGGGVLMVTPPNAGLRPYRPVFQENQVIENVARSLGGGMEIGDVELTLSSNKFIRNRAASDGGALRIYTGIEIVGNQFWENSAGNCGGAIEFDLNPGPNRPAFMVSGNLFVRNYTDRSGGTTSGTDITCLAGRGVIAENTFVGFQEDNEGSGEVGAVRLIATEGVEIGRNIFQGSTSYAVLCQETAQATFQGNILWMNATGTVGSVGGCLGDWEESNFLVDPLFCDPFTDNFTVSKDSPALGEHGPIGAFPNPGCGDGVAVESATWGRIKARYE